MKVNLTSASNYSHQEDLPDNVDENDPRQLRKIIDHLIKKSKLVITTLENTVVQLEKVEGERDYWKHNYLRFKEVCQKYIDEDGIQHFKQLAGLESELKRLQIQKNCLIEENKIKDSRKFGLERESKETCAPKNGNGESDTKLQSSKKKMYKSITTLSYSKQSPRREHQLHPKTKKVVKPFPIVQSKQE